MQHTKGAILNRIQQFASLARSDSTYNRAPLPTLSFPSFYLYDAPSLPKLIVAVDVFIKGVCASRALNFNKTHSLPEECHILIGPKQN